MKQKWINRFQELSEHIAGWSKDPNRKVGCVIVDEANHILATGYNGFPKDIEDDEKSLYDQDLKRKMMVHAERNAVDRMEFALFKPKEINLFCTTFPCDLCAKRLAKSNVTCVYAPQPNLEHPYWGQKYINSLKILLGNGIDIAYFPFHETPDISFNIRGLNETYNGGK